MIVVSQKKPVLSLIKNLRSAQEVHTNHADKYVIQKKL